VNQGAVPANFEKFFESFPSRGVIAAADGPARWAATGGPFDALNPSKLLFPAYSVSKTFIAAVVLDAGVNLDEPMPLPFNVPAWLEGRSWRQYLQHRTGLGDYGTYRDYHLSLAASPSEPPNVYQWRERIFQQGPNEGFHYSNLGYRLVVEALEQRQGTTLASLVSDRIAKPLGLEHTFVATELADMKKLAPATSALLGSATTSVAKYHPGWVMHGLVVSTAPELARFIRRLFSGNVLSAENTQAMRELAVVGASGKEFTPSYGLGVHNAWAPKGKEAFGHFGGGPGFSVAAFAYTASVSVESRVAVVAGEVGDGLGIAMQRLQ